MIPSKSDSNRNASGSTDKREISFQFLELFQTSENDVLARLFYFPSQEYFIEDGVNL